jgi:antitoxin (DNA-binding transcriptional repressor) of toxin-antitoxin stability system
MRAMEITELKALLSETLARVNGGEEILVTERDALVARLVPPSAASPAGDGLVVVGNGLILRPPEKPLDETFWKLERPAWRVPPRHRFQDEEAEELREAV